MPSAKSNCIATKVFIKLFNISLTSLHLKLQTTTHNPHILFRLRSQSCMSSAQQQCNNDLRTLASVTIMSRANTCGEGGVACHNNTVPCHMSHCAPSHVLLPPQLIVQTRAANDPSGFKSRRAFSWLKAPTCAFAFKTLC